MSYDVKVYELAKAFCQDWKDEHPESLFTVEYLANELAEELAHHIDMYLEHGILTANKQPLNRDGDIDDSGHQIPSIMPGSQRK